MVYILYLHTWAWKYIRTGAIINLKKYNNSSAYVSLFRRTPKYTFIKVSWNHHNTRLMDPYECFLFFFLSIFWNFIFLLVLYVHIKKNQCAVHLTRNTIDCTLDQGSSSFSLVIWQNFYAFFVSYLNSAASVEMEYVYMDKAA